MTKKQLKTQYELVINQQKLLINRLEQGFDQSFALNTNTIDSQKERIIELEHLIDNLEIDIKWINEENGRNLIIVDALLDKLDKLGK